MLTNQASTDRTFNYFNNLARKSKNVTVFNEVENTGFIPPGDRAYRIAIERGIPYLLLLNDDTMPPRGFLEKLVKPLEEIETAALSGPSGGCCTLLDNFHGSDGPHFEYVEGSCLMVRIDRVRALLGDEHLFDPGLRFIYGDDSNLSLRVREAGLTIHRADFAMPHLRNQTTRSPQVRERCAQAQAANHDHNARRFGHYIRTRRFDYPTVIRRRFSLGDVLLSTPVIHTLRAMRPLSPIHVETDAPELFEGNPDIAKADRAIPEMKDEIRINLDMAYEDLTEVPIIDAYCLRVEHAIGDRINLLDRKLIYYGTKPHEMERTSALLSAVNDKPIAAIHAQNSWPGKTWPAERWVEIVRFLQESGRRVILVGGAKDMLGIPADLDLRGDLNIGESAFALMMSCLFVGIDSFPMHLAMSQGTPTIGLFGVSSPEIILSEGMAIGVQASREIAPCAGERHRVRGATFVDCDGACMRAISVEMVKDAIVKIWERESAESEKIS